MANKHPFDEITDQAADDLVRVSDHVAESIVGRHGAPWAAQVEGAQKPGYWGLMDEGQRQAILALMTEEERSELARELGVV
jgi:hypothetical protein